MLNKLYNSITSEEVCYNCANKNNDNTCKLDNHKITQTECFDRCDNFVERPIWIEGEAFIKCRFCGYLDTVDKKKLGYCPKCGKGKQIDC